MIRDARRKKDGQFAIEIFKQINKEVIVNRVTTEEYGVSIAKRPHNSRLNKSMLICNRIRFICD
jgi:dTDP-4-dehydrorhamnose reductase